MKVIALDGCSTPLDLGVILGEVEVEAPVTCGQELLLPCGTRSVVSRLIDEVREPRWVQYVAVECDPSGRTDPVAVLRRPLPSPTPAAGTW